jgi:hypothetical protein
MNLRFLWAPLCALGLGAGCAMTSALDPIPAPSCAHNVNGRLDSIFNNYYPEYKQKGPSGGTTWFARKDLEVARWYLNPAEGYATGGSTCQPAEMPSPGYAQLRTRLGEAQRLVLEMENARGLHFVTVENQNHLVYTDAQGKQITSSDQL